MQRILLISALALAGSFLPGQAALQYVKVNSPVNTTLLAATCDADRTFVGVGTNATVLTGKFVSGAMSWTRHTVPNSISLQSATWGNNVFAAGGTGGYVVTSSDGLNWGSPTTPFPGFTAYIMGLGFNPRSASPRFVATPAMFVIAYSPASLQPTWSRSTINQYSLAESWRAVAPFGANAFVACGLLGDIRTSADGGVNWNLSRVPKTGQNDLLGVASDGGNRIVAVGAGGAILFSSNGGGSWSQRSLPGTGRPDLNAITYDALDGLFIAAGNSSAAYSSSDGLNWNFEAPPSSGNFRGVTFANANSLAGVGLLVGDGGSAVLAGTPPAAPIDAVNQTNCALSLPNPPLSVTILNDSTHPPGTLVVDWYATPSGGSPVAVATTVYVPQDQLPAFGNTAAVYTYYAQARDLRTGFVSPRTAATLRINPRPFAPTNAVFQTNCALALPNPSLQVTPDTTGIAEGRVTVDWYATESGGTPVATDTNSYSPPDQLPAPGNVAAFYTYYAQARVINPNCPSGCLDCVSTNRTAVTLRINPRPFAPVNPLDQTNCALSLPNPSLQVTPNTTGIEEGPVVVDWYATPAGGAPVATATIAFSPPDQLPGPGNTATVYTYYAQARVVNTNCSSGCLDCVSTNRTAVTLRINPRPFAPVNPVDQTNCALSLPNPALQVTPNTTGIAEGTVVVDWYTAASGGTRVAVGTNSYSPPDELPGAGNTATVYTYYAQARVVNLNCPSGCLDCVSTNRTAVTLRINPRPFAPINPVDQTNCALSLPNPALQVTPNTTGIAEGTVVVDWYTAASGGTRVAVATNSYSPPDQLPGAGNTAIVYTYYAQARVVNLNCPSGCLDCVSTNRTAVTLRINPRPFAPVNPVDQTNCALSLPNPALQVTPNTTGIAEGTVVVDWYTAASGGTRVAVATNSYSPPDELPGAGNAAIVYTYYAQARVVNLNCPSGCLDCVSTNRTGVTLRINPRPFAPVNSTVLSTNCAGLPDSPLSANVITTGITEGQVVVDWYDLASAGTRLATATNSFYPPESTAGTYRYFAEARVVNPNCPTHCLDCVSTNRTQITFVVNSTPPAPTNATQVLTNCAGLPAYPLTVTVVTNGTFPAGALTVDWYDASMNLLQAGAFTHIPTNEVAGTYTNYARTRVLATQCQSATLTEVPFVVNPTPPAPSNVTQVLTNCASLPAYPLTVTVVTNGTFPAGALTVDWYDASMNLLRAGAFTHIPTNEVAGTYTNYARTRVLATQCQSATLTEVPFVVNPTPPAPSNVTQVLTNCAGLPAYPLTVTVVTNGTFPAGALTVDWYDASMNLLEAGAFMHPPTNQIAGTYTNYARTRVMATGCESAILTPVSFLVNPLPQPPSNPISQIGCYGLTNLPMSVTLLAGETANWYQTSNGITPIYSGPWTYGPTNAPVGTNRYWVSAVSAAGCESATRQEVDLVVEDCPKLLSISLVETNALVEWHGNYMLQSATNLASPLWDFAMQGLPGSNNVFTITNVISSPASQFYRLYGPTN